MGCGASKNDGVAKNGAQPPTSPHMGENGGTAMGVDDKAGTPGGGKLVTQGGVGGSAEEGGQVGGSGGDSPRVPPETSTPEQIKRQKTKSKEGVARPGGGGGGGGGEGGEWGRSTVMKQEKATPKKKPVKSPPPPANRAATRQPPAAPAAPAADEDEEDEDEDEEEDEDEVGQGGWGEEEDEDPASLRPRAQRKEVDMHDPLRTLVAQTKMDNVIKGSFKDRYELKRVIGAGAFGQAYLAERLWDGEEVAVKTIRLKGMSAQEQAESRKEIEVLRELDHPMIVQYLDCAVEDNVMYIVMEFADAGDLHSYLEERKKRKPGERYLTENEVMFHFVQICLALQFVHNKKILHRDLKTQNIFRSRGNILKLGDFGISRMLSSESDVASTVVGTPYYLSPEICEDRPYNHKSDIWSLGCILYEMASLNHAFDGQSLPALVVKILRGKYPALPERYSKDLKDLVAAMLNRDPKTRLSLGQILKKPYVKGHLERFWEYLNADKTRDILKRHNSLRKAVSGYGPSQGSMRLSSTARGSTGGKKKKKKKKGKGSMRKMGGSMHACSGDHDAASMSRKKKKSSTRTKRAGSVSTSSSMVDIGGAGAHSARGEVEQHKQALADEVRADKERIRREREREARAAERESERRREELTADLERREEERRAEEERVKSQKRHHKDVMQHVQPRIHIERPKSGGRPRQQDVPVEIYVPSSQGSGGAPGRHHARDEEAEDEDEDEDDEDDDDDEEEEEDDEEEEEEEHRFNRSYHTLQQQIQHINSSKHEEDPGTPVVSRTALSREELDQEDEAEARELGERKAKLAEEGERKMGQAYKTAYAYLRGTEETGDDPDQSHLTGILGKFVGSVRHVQKVLMVEERLREIAARRHERGHAQTRA